MARFRANQGDFDLEDAKLLRSTEHVLLLNLGDINRPPHFNGKQQLPRSLQETDQYSVLPHYLVRNTAHVTVLLEAGGLKRHSDLFVSIIRCALLPCLMGTRIRSLVYAQRTTLRPGLSFCAAFNLTQIALIGLRARQLLELLGARSMRTPTGASRPIKESTQIFAKHLKMAKILPRIWESSFVQIGTAKRQPNSARPSLLMPAPVPRKSDIPDW